MKGSTFTVQIGLLFNKEKFVSRALVAGALPFDEFAVDGDRIRDPGLEPLPLPAVRQAAVSHCNKK